MGRPSAKPPKPVHGLNGSPTVSLFRESRSHFPWAFFSSIPLTKFKERGSTPAAISIARSRHGRPPEPFCHCRLAPGNKRRVGERRPVKASRRSLSTTTRGTTVTISHGLGCRQMTKILWPRVSRPPVNKPPLDSLPSSSLPARSACFNLPHIDRSAKNGQTLGRFNKNIAPDNDKVGFPNMTSSNAPHPPRAAACRGDFIRLLHPPPTPSPPEPLEPAPKRSPLPVCPSLAPAPRPPPAN